MSFAKPGDSSNIIDVSLESLPAGWTNPGSATFDDRGVLCTTGGIRIDLGTDTRLDAEGSCSFLVTTKGIAQFDDELDIVSGSAGVDRAAARAIAINLRSDDNSDTIRIEMDTAGNMFFRANGTDGAIDRFITTIGKAEYCLIYLYWTPTLFGAYVNFEQVFEETNTDRSIVGRVDRISVGAAVNGTTTPFAPLDNLYIRDFILNPSIPNLPTNPKYDLDLFGDSYVARALETSINTIGSFGLLDGRFNFKYRAYFARLGFEVVLNDSSDGHGGFTISNTATDNLSAEFAGFLASTTAQNVMIMAGANDSGSGGASEAEITNVTTGAYANLTTWLTSLFAAGKSNVYVAVGAPLVGNIASNNSTARQKRRLIESAGRAAVADFNNANNTNMAKFVPMFDILGTDLDQNVMQQGFLNLQGNANGGTIIPANEDDIHPTALGHGSIANYMADVVYVDNTSGAGPFLTGPLTSSLTG